MSRLISDILEAPEPRFSHTIRHWEQMTGNTGHDVRLVSDIAHARKQALKELQLDHGDTTPRELYYALRHRAQQTAHELERELAITDDMSPDEMLERVISFINKLPVNRETWTIKPAVIKQLLIKQAPKKTMRVLGLRSIDSVLKRSSSCELLTLAYQIESPEWSKKMRQSLKKLQPSDFQTSASITYQLSASRAQKIRKSDYATARIIAPNYETGTIVVIPPSRRFKLDVLALTLSLLETLYELRIYSAHFRAISVDAKFGARLYTALQEGVSSSPQNATISWRVLQKHFNHDASTFTQIEQPHLQYDDVIIEAPLQVLSSVLPTGKFWSNTTYVFMSDSEKPVSMHILDVVTNASNELPYEKATMFHLQQQLWEELGLRYLQHGSMQREVLQRHADTLN